MKRKVWTLLGLLVVATMIMATGCAPKTTPAPTEQAEQPTAQPEQPTTPPEPPAGEPVKVTILVGFGTGDAPDQITAHEEIAQEFNDTHEDIQVEFLTVPHDEYQAKFSTMLAGDLAPDLVMPTGVAGVAEFFDEWLDITPYIEQDNYDLSDFYGPTVDLHTYPDKMVGLPMGVYPSVIFYNEDLFDAAGVDYPPQEFGDPDWTYAKLTEIGRELTLDANGNNADSPDFDPENIVQWAYDASWQEFRCFPPKFGGDTLGMSADYKTAEMNSAPWVEAMQWVADRIWKDHITASDEQSGAFYDAADDPFSSGMLGMWESHSWMAYAFDGWNDAFNWNVAAIPAGPHGDLVASIDADTFAIPQSSKHPDEAWEVAKWMAQPDIMLRLTKIWGSLPARKSISDKWMEDMQASYPDVNFQLFLDSIDYLDAPNNEAWVPSYGKVNDAVENARALVLTGENTNVQEVMDDLNAEVQGYLDEYWAAQ